MSVENENTKKVTSWADLSEKDFLEAVRNPSHYQVLRSAYPNLELYLQVLKTYPDGSPETVAVWNPFRNDLEIYRYEKDKNGSTKLIKDTTTNAEQLKLELSIDKQQLKTLKKDLKEFVSLKVKEEKENIDKLLNACISTYTSEPMNIAVVGASSEGKSFLVENVVKLFPDEDVEIYRSVTPKAFTRLKGYKVIPNPNPYASEEDKYVDFVEVNGEKIGIDERIKQLKQEIEELKRKNESNEIIKEKKAELQKLEKESLTCIDFRHKIIVFLEEPSREFWKDFLPVLSHDQYWTLTLFTEGEGFKHTRKVVYRGWPTVIYCTSKTSTTFGWEDLNTRFQVIEPVQTKQKYDLAVQQIFDDLNLKMNDYKLKERERKLRAELKAFTNLIKNKQIYMFTPFDAKVLQKIFSGAEQGKVMRFSKYYKRHIEMNALWNYYNRFIFKNEGLENGAEPGEHILIGNEDIESVLNATRKKYEFLAQMNGLPISATEFLLEIVIPAYNSKRSQANEKQQQTLEDENTKQEDYDLTVAYLCDIAKSYCAANPSTSIKSSKVTVTRYLKILAERGLITYENKDKSKTAGKPKIVIPQVTEEDLWQASGSETVSQTVSQTVSYDLKDKLASFDMVAAPCPKNETVSQTVSSMESIKYSSIEPEFKPLNLLTNSLSITDIEKAILKLSGYTTETPTETVNETVSETLTETPTETVNETPLIAKFFELLNIIFDTCETVNETVQNSNKVLDSQPPEPQPPPQPEPQPEPRPQPPPAPQAHEPDSPSFNAQAQEPGSIALPGPVLDSLQKEQTSMLMVDKPMQQEAPAEPHEQAPALTKEEIAQRVYLAVKLSERDNESFWSDPELGEPNKKLYPVLQGLTTGVIQEALKSLQWQGYITETKPGYWHAVRDPRFVDLLAYDNPDMPIYCPNCMKPVTRLYWYDTEWLCVDCLNARQHQNDDLYA